LSTRRHTVGATLIPYAHTSDSSRYFAAQLSFQQLAGFRRACVWRPITHQIIAINNGIIAVPHRLSG